MKRFLLSSLTFYRAWISPAMHSVFASGCRFHPTCSEYASEAITLHGAMRGSGLAIRRLMRCHPFGGSGFDPVPLPKEDGPPAALPASATLHDPLP